MHGKVPVHLVFFNLHESQARVIFCRVAPFLLFAVDRVPDSVLLREAGCESTVSTGLSLRNIPASAGPCMPVRAALVAMLGSAGYQNQAFTGL